MKIENPVIPTVNLNGTDGKVLLGQYVEAMRKADDLVETLSKMFPHGRDYQLAPDTYGGARDQFSDIMKQVTEIHGYLQTVALGINNQL